MNLRIIGTRLGEDLKYSVSVSSIERAAHAVFDFAAQSYPVGSITSVRAQSIYDWVMTLAEEGMPEEKKAQLLSDFITLLGGNPETYITTPIPCSKPEPSGAEENTSNRVFVSHGHDEGLRETVARFIEKLGLEAIILHEQPDRGRTIIEKFEDYSDVAYAVVLLTPDDVGKEAGGEDDLKPRARQNVILELGFFLGKLGREKVCALYKEEVDIPSDYAGVLYLPVGVNRVWRFRLARELRDAGLPMSLDKAL